MEEFNINIGERIKRLRHMRNLTLQDVANFTGFSKALISQIENNVVTPPITTLAKIAKVLNVKMVYFFEDDLDFKEYYLVKKNDRKIAYREGAKHGYIYEELAHIKNNDIFESFVVTIRSEPREKKLFSHEGYEFMYILEGGIRMYLNNDVVTLEEGDSISFSSKIPHYAETLGDKDAKILSIRMKSIDIKALINQAGKDK
ncbi:MULTISPECIES: helix-turn-helix domain-containing protein [Calditerrivibrio]|uniref:Helix-turn-helix domain protein n=1 Tax=Calditerrivibrio nitroreducens (strain DSM 19672 / NBRC 101217 / Yu37-1) TaxID=768670 RepID=E4TGV7_CALNY|nr:XRE family transcriptional regulator [Calditerrivibrio nitroreducens]ADR18717.1 helix-turn-helix domain protein [Calditerrivibrio nitroreducens DSM 19672]